MAELTAKERERGKGKSMKHGIAHALFNGVLRINRITGYVPKLKAACRRLAAQRDAECKRADRAEDVLRRLVEHYAVKRDAARGIVWAGWSRNHADAIAAGEAWEDALDTLEPHR